MPSTWSMCPEEGKCGRQQLCFLLPTTRVKGLDLKILHIPLPECAYRGSGDDLKDDCASRICATNMMQTSLQSLLYVLSRSISSWHSDKSREKMSEIARVTKTSSPKLLVDLPFIEATIAPK